jgi:GNAT superfamily N-acetyltransferase
MRFAPGVFHPDYIRKQKGITAMIIKPLAEAQIEEAAHLFSTLYQRQRQETPLLDERNGQREAIMERLAECLKQHPGVAAWEHGKMLGYMTGFFIDELLGPAKGVLSTERLHASAAEGAFEMYRKMYQVIGQQWMEAGCLTHAINFMHHAREAQDAFCWNGFGRVGIDAIRPVQLLDSTEERAGDIRPVTADDVATWLPLQDGQEEHLAHSPAFLPWLERETESNLAHWLAQPGNHAWIAFSGGEAIGTMRISPQSFGAAWIVEGGNKYSITGAFVRSEHRKQGIAKALLNTVLQWGIDHDMQRCSVDFEATNLEACAFWLRYFQPACASMIRRLDVRIRLSLQS